MKSQITRMLYRFGFLVLLISMVSGCASTKSLTIDERSSIRSIYIDDQLPSQIGYLKTGLTRFGNSEERWDGRAEFDAVIRSARATLEAEGFLVVQSVQDADCILRIIPQPVPTFTSTKGMTGAQYFGYSALGITHGATARVAILYEIAKPQSNDVWASFSDFRFIISEHKEAPETWSDFKEDTQSELKEIMKKLLQESAEVSLEKVGLL